MQRRITSCSNYPLGSFELPYYIICIQFSLYFLMLCATTVCCGQIPQPLRRQSPITAKACQSNLYLTLITKISKTSWSVSQYMVGAIAFLQEFLQIIPIGLNTSMVSFFLSLEKLRNSA